VTCALAAALVEMSAAFAGEPAAAVAGPAGVRAGQLRRRALELADLDLASYLPVLQALRLPADDPARPGDLADALSGAVEVPLELSRISAEVSGLAAEVADVGSRHLVGDAAAGTVLAQAACQAAATLVQINLSSATDERPAEAAQWCENADVARRQALAKARET
jgi:formiminotetrahydrofolate cyclodeaminase